MPQGYLRTPSDFTSPAPPFNDSGKFRETNKFNNFQTYAPARGLE